MRFAIIENNTVVNVAEAVEALATNWLQSDVAGIGWAYEGGVFIAPTTPQPTPIEDYSLTLKQFWARFTPAEREALQNLLATGTQAQKNKLNAFRDYVTHGGNVELNDDYIIDSVTLMQTAGIIAGGRASVILTP